MRLTPTVKGTRTFLVYGSAEMNMLRRFARDEEGASLVEYTILLGIITVAVIAVIINVGGWVGNQWNALWGNLQNAGV